MEKYFLKKYSDKLSFSQSGEDRLVLFILNHQFNITNITYLDIGANDPVALSNTYLFYVLGCQGVLVEPDPDLVTILKQKRPNDTILQKAVITDESKKDLDFFLVQPNTLNTFSEKEIKLYQQHYQGVSVREKIKVSTATLQSLMDDHFTDGLDFLSIDIEGLDYDILQTLDFSHYRPKVICVETMVYGKKNSLQKSPEVVELLIKNDYFVYADTYVNTIFVDKKLWRKHALPNLSNMEGWNK